MMSTRFLHGSPSLSNTVCLTISARSRAGAYMLQGYRTEVQDFPSLRFVIGKSTDKQLFCFTAAAFLCQIQCRLLTTIQLFRKTRKCWLSSKSSEPLSCCAEANRVEMRWHHILLCHAVLHACRGRRRMGHLALSGP